MAQSTWAAKTNTWADDIYTWRATTIQESITFSGDTSLVLGYNTKYVVAADLTQVNFSELHEEDRVSLLNGLLDTSVSVSAVGTLIQTESIEFDSAVGNNASVIAELVGNITLGADTSIVNDVGTLIPVTAAISQVIFSELNEEDAIKLASALMDMSTGTTASASIVATLLGTLSHTQNLKNNINFEEGGTIGMTSSTNSNNNFLWNDITEDTSTTWTKVADPDE